MKKIFSILAVLFCLSASGQPIIQRSLPPVTAQDARLKAGLNFYLPHIRGFNPGNGFGLNGGLDTLGAEVYDDSSQHVYFRDTILSGGKKWAVFLKTGDAGLGTVTQILTGWGISGGPITTTGTLKADSATMATYFIRRGDSTYAYITPTQLAAQGFLKNINGIVAGGDLTGTYANPTIAAGAVTYAKFQQLPAFTFLGNPQATTATSQASYFGYGLRWNNDSVKVDTTLLKNIFGSAAGGITQLSGDGTAGPGSGPQVFTLATVNGNVFPSNTFLKVAENAKGLTTSATPVVASDIIGVLGLTPISLSSLSATAPIVYNNSTGVISCPTCGVSGGGISSLNALTAANQTFAIGYSGTSVNILSSGTVHTFNTPLSNGVDTGLVIPAQVALWNSKISLTALSATAPIAYNNSTGVISMNSSGVTPGTYSNATVIVNSFGIVTGISAGTVPLTSVGLAAPSTLLTVSGSPLTSNGTITLALATASANTVFGNFTGSSATPTFGKVNLTSMATNTANTLIGYDGSGNPIDITVSTGLNLAAGVLTSTGGGSQTLTYTQLALNNTLSISGGNTVTFLVATHALSGLMDSASKAVVDSIRLRTYAFPTNIISAAQGLHASITGDSILKGGFYYQNDTTNFEGFSEVWIGLPGKGTLAGTDSVLIKDASNNLKWIPNTLFSGGGGGAVTLTSPNSTISITGSGTSTLTVDLNLATANQWAANILANANASFTIGNGTNNWLSVNSHQFVSNNSMIFGIPSLDSYTWNINSAATMALLSSGQLRINNYNSSSAFPGTGVAILEVDASGNILTAALGGTQTLQQTFTVQANNAVLTSSDTVSGSQIVFLDNIKTGGTISPTVASGGDVGTGSLPYLSVHASSLASPGAITLSALTGNGLSFSNGSTRFQILATGQEVLPNYTATTSFTLGSPVGMLVFDASGNIGTAAIPGGGGGGIGVDSTITITTGASSTVTNGYNVIYFNPSSTLSSYTLTLPTTWHSSRTLYIVFSPSAFNTGNVVTALTIVAGSGQTLAYPYTNSPPISGIWGQTLVYHLVAGTVDQYISSTN